VLPLEEATNVKKYEAVTPMAVVATFVAVAAIFAFNALLAVPPKILAFKVPELGTKERVDEVLKGSLLVELVFVHVKYTVEGLVLFDVIATFVAVFAVVELTLLPLQASAVVATEAVPFNPPTKF
jgi:hypothetical protein